MRPSRDEGIAVVEQERGAAGEPARQPVPHHPAAGGEVEQPVAFAYVAVQLVFLQVLQQRAARAVDDALGHAGGARGIQDVERMIEGQGGEIDAVHAGERRDEVPPAHCLGYRIVQRGFGHVGNDDDSLDRMQLARHLTQLAQHVDRLAVVEVAIDADQHFGRHLPKAIQRTLHAEIRETRK